MTQVRKLFLALLLTTAAATVPTAARLMASPAEAEESSGQPQKATLKPVAASSPDIPFHNDEEFQTEQRLLALANQSRRQAGAPELTLDPGLSEAARIHAQIMLDAQQLSHQFPREPSLPQRLATATHLLLDQEGENVALDYDAEHGHQHLMLSPRIARTFSTRPTTWSGWVWFVAETGSISCRISPMPSPAILRSKRQSRSPRP